MGELVSVHAEAGIKGTTFDGRTFASMTRIGMCRVLRGDVPTIRKFAICKPVPGPPPQINGSIHSSAVGEIYKAILIETMELFMDTYQANHYDGVVVCCPHNDVNCDVAEQFLKRLPESIAIMYKLW